jgi:hypothetical protein
VETVIALLVVATVIIIFAAAYTLTNGEILKGEYQVTENASVAMAISGSHMATGVGYGSGRHTVVSATGS